MNYTEHKITLDIHKSVSHVSICVKKGDTGRRLLIHLAEKGYPYKISHGCYAVFTAKKPDGKVVFNDCNIEGGVIRYDFTPQTVAAIGIVTCEIILYGAGGEQLTSASFNIIVEDSIYDKDAEIESTNEYNALADLVSKIIGFDGIPSVSTVRTSYVTLLADAWVGDSSPYTQVVSLEGVTENSQVAINLSLEQAERFRQKELAFIAENEGGVVTVGAIGQKPANDYTFQVTITEVYE